MSIIASHLSLNIAKTVRDSLGSKGQSIGMAYGESNGHVIDDVA